MKRINLTTTRSCFRTDAARLWQLLMPMDWDEDTPQSPNAAPETIRHSFSRNVAARLGASDTFNTAWHRIYLNVPFQYLEAGGRPLKKLGDGSFDLLVCGSENNVVLFGVLFRDMNAPPSQSGEPRPCEPHMDKLEDADAAVPYAILHYPESKGPPERERAAADAAAAIGVFLDEPPPWDTGPAVRLRTVPVEPWRRDGFIWQSLTDGDGSVTAHGWSDGLVEQLCPDPGGAGRTDYEVLERKAGNLRFLLALQYLNDNR